MWLLLYVREHLVDRMWGTRKFLFPYILWFALKRLIFQLKVIGSVVEVDHYDGTAEVITKNVKQIGGVRRPGAEIENRGEHVEINLK